MIDPSSPTAYYDAPTVRPFIEAWLAAHDAAFARPERDAQFWELFSLATAADNLAWEEMGRLAALSPEEREAEAAFLRDFDAAIVAAQH